MSDKTIDLKPTYTFLFWWYFLGALLVPFLGIGLIVILLAYKKQTAIIYEMGNQSITKTVRTTSETVDLVDIIDIKVQQRWIDKKLSAGTLLLITETKNVELVGIRNPHSLTELILRAAESERALLRQKMIPNPPSNSAPISLDRLDYLTGLWQQGLLSDEDFKKEKKHFES